MYCMISQEVTEANSPAAEELFVEIFNDKDSFVDLLVDNIKKADDVEQEMCRGQKRLASLRDEDDVDEPVVMEDPEGVLNRKVIEVMDKFEDKNMVTKTRFVRLQIQKGQRTVSIAHPRIQKKAGEDCFNCDFKQLAKLPGNPFKITTGNGTFTNLYSDQIYGRGNIGPAQCTHIPLKSLDANTRQRLLHTFNEEEEDEDEEANLALSQDFPYMQFKCKDTLKICNVCDYRSRDNHEVEGHIKTHFKCDICEKRYKEETDLMQHIQAHLKVPCDECKEEVREDQLENHKINHNKLKKKFTKVKVNQKEKKPKTVTAYILWQKEERQKIAGEN